MALMTDVESSFFRICTTYSSLNPAWARGFGAGYSSVMYVDIWHWVSPGLCVLHCIGEGY